MRISNATYVVVVPVSKHVGQDYIVGFALHDVMSAVVFTRTYGGRLWATDSKHDGPAYTLLED